MIDQDRDGIIGPDDLAAIYNQIGQNSVTQSQVRTIQIRCKADSCMGTTTLPKVYRTV